MKRGLKSELRKRATGSFEGEGTFPDEEGTEIGYTKMGGKKASEM